MFLTMLVLVASFLKNYARQSVFYSMIIIPDLAAGGIV